MGTRTSQNNSNYWRNYIARKNVQLHRLFIKANWAQRPDSNNCGENGWV